MVVIRLARGGNRNRPYFYIAVADSRARLQGRFIEKIGFHNPLANENTESFRIDSERLNHWVSVGAQTSPAVKKLLKTHAAKQAA
ncbi:MAG: 30S ribosomal protein S16 [Proteobacteria bacterium]|jgi:small subunit ribosomal protein S16|nr:30S ribosomal protein S16 [Pseudomonadota bacterium]